jgi:hypothetical protein
MDLGAAVGGMSIAGVKAGHSVVLVLLGVGSVHLGCTRDGRNVCLDLFLRRWPFEWRY